MNDFLEDFPHLKNNKEFLTAFKEQVDMLEEVTSENLR